MTVPVIQTNFVKGELDPKLWGHTDLGSYKVAVATARNMTCGYTGGLYSRAGTALVGRCKQTPPNAPPRDIPFSFSLSQGYALEFGDQYMRVKSAGAYVLEAPLTVTGATQANPIVVTATSFGVTAATPVNTGVLSSYAPGDLVTLAGGSFLRPAKLAVTTTQLTKISVAQPGIGNYAPGDTISLTGGTQTTPAQLTVAATRVFSATIASPGSGGTDGTQTVTGTTGTGSLFQISVTVSGGVITAILGIVDPGIYTVNPTDPTMEPVTGASLSGAQLNVVMGVQGVTITAAGVFTANPASGQFAQNVSSGSGTGASFFGAIMGIHAASVSDAGVYAVVPANPVSQSSTTGIGFGATFNLTTASGAAFATGDWVFFQSVGGMTQLNGNTYIVGTVSGNTFTLKDLDGNNINSLAYSAYTTGGEVSRLFTLTTPYAAADLDYLKYAQDTDTMSLTCVNSVAGTEYAPQELKRFGAANWTIAPLNLDATIPPPGGVSAAASNHPNSMSSPPTEPCAYAYVVTAVDLITGQESVASNIANVTDSVDMGVTAGSITVNWSQIVSTNPVAYNIYRTAPAYNTDPGNASNALPVPVGAQFFFAGSSYGNQFVDTNTITDASRTPPLHLDPFARGGIPSVTITSSNNDWTTATASITTGTGTGWDGEVVIVGGVVIAVIVIDAGKGYLPGDTLVITGDGTAAAGILHFGPESGTYPGVVAYFQTRRIYAMTLNQPDTFFASQTERFLNFDTSNPPVDTDAITSSPFSQTANGIQWLLPTLGGLVMLTGNGAWQLTGTGGSAFSPIPITPSSEQATPQAVNGADAVCPPVKVNNDIIFLSSTGQFFYELNYTIYFNSYTVIDISYTSGHLFLGESGIKQTAWCLQPYKLLWTIREDGVMLSLTWLKEQEVAGWTRHDTQGLFRGVCTITEPPVDALYLIVERYVQGRWLYFAERMNNRIWKSVEDTWCVDCGLSTLTATSFPAATLTPNAASGAGVVFVASAGVFSSPNIGSIIRAGGGIATITGFTNSTHVVGTWTRPMSATIPNDPNGTPVPQPSGDWSLLPQVTTVSGLGEISGKQVVGLCDGIPIGGGATFNPLYPGPFTVANDGTVALPFAASLITLGLAFLPQMQSLYLDEGQPTVQGKRKTINDATARLSASGWPFVSANQPDGSSLDPMQIAPVWAPGQQMKPTPPGQTAPSPPYLTAAGKTVQPLTTGDVRSNVASTWRKPGQLALQQPLPLPLNVTALITDDLPGDTPEVALSQRQPAGNGNGQRQARQ